MNYRIGYQYWPILVLKNWLYVHNVLVLNACTCVYHVLSVLSVWITMILCLLIHVHVHVFVCLCIHVCVSHLHGLVNVVVVLHTFIQELFQEFRLKGTQNTACLVHSMYGVWRQVPVKFWLWTPKMDNMTQSGSKCTCTLL